MKEPGETKHTAWTMKEYRVLWHALKSAKLTEESGWKERMESAWRGAGTRDVSQRSLVNKLREIKFGKMIRLERENIARGVKRQYLCKKPIP